MQVAKASSAELDAVPSLDVASLGNGCQWVRPNSIVVKEEKEVYNATMFKASTCYCHHFSEEGLHLVLAGLPSSRARKCHGVLYFSVGITGKKLTCGPRRGEPMTPVRDYNHSPCTEERCAFLKEAGHCPYMAKNGTDEK